MSQVITNFMPAIHGFHFANDFINAVFDTKIASWHTRGRCGGMAFGSLDYYYANLSIPTHRGPNFPNGKVPEDNSRLAQYIYARLFDSFALNGAMFISWTEKFDHYTILYDEGVPKLTKSQQFPILMEKLKVGPVALGLIFADHLVDIGNNHQVVAYGAEINDATGDLTVYIYDNRYPEEEVTLTSDANLYTHFTLTRPNGNQQDCRGFFVEAYSPQVPSYVDLACVSSPLVISPCHIADLVECTFTVQNFGDYDASLEGFTAITRDPSGKDRSDLFLPDPVNSLAPGAQHLCNLSSDKLGPPEGKYVIRPAYVCSRRPLALPIESQGRFVVCSGTIVEVSGLSWRITAPTPFLQRVEAIYVTDGAAESAKCCERPFTFYRAEWVEVDAATRKLQVTSEPIIACPTKTVQFILCFASHGKMRDDALRLTLVGKAPDNSDLKYPVTLKGYGWYYTGTWKPDGQWQKLYRLTLQIDGADDVSRIDNRVPHGDILDSNPQTIASVNVNTAGYPFKGYEPGTDKNHAVDIAARTLTLPTDSLEKNDDFGSATKVPLALPGIYKGSWGNFENLNFQNASDRDYFAVSFQTLPSDDTNTSDNPVTFESSSLGIIGTVYPPAVCIAVTPQGHFCTDLDIYKLGATGATPSLVKSLQKEISLTLYNPVKQFGGKSFYLVIKNSSFAYQGAFAYSVALGYLPKHAICRAPLAIQLPQLKRYYADLPRPSDDILGKAVSKDFPYTSGAWIITDMKAFVTELRRVLEDPATMADINAAYPAEADSFLASALFDLGKLAQTSQLTAEAGQLYTIAAGRFAAAGLSLRQSEVLKTMAKLTSRLSVPVVAGPGN